MTTLLNPPTSGAPSGGEADRPETGRPLPTPDPQTATTSTARQAAPARATSQPFPLSIVFTIALVVVLGGFGAWAAISNLHSQGIDSWEAIPAGSGYSTTAPAPPPTPLVPASAKTAAATGSSASALPPMVETAPVTAITLKVDPPPLGGTYGPHGQIQDNFSPAYFAAPAGKTVHVTILNYDSAWHTFSAPALGLNVWVRPGGDQPSEVTFTFTAPKAGYYQWRCAVPCDPFSMGAAGYMQGSVHVTSA